MKTKSPDGRTPARLEEARRWFQQHHAGASPDAGFAARVAARLRRDPAEDLGAAALRLLPASLALALVLALLATFAPKPEERKADSDLDVVEWVYGESVSSR